MSDLCRKLFFCCAPNRSKVDYDNVLADSEREAVADLLNYLENEGLLLKILFHVGKVI
jgi:vacuolar protein 8